MSSTALISLRRATNLDSSLIATWTSNPEVLRHFGRDRELISTPQTWHRALLSTDFQVYIAADRTARPIGLTIFYRFDPKNISAYTSTLVGFPQEWGRGLGFSMKAAQIDFARHKLGVGLLYAKVLVDNLRAVNMLMKAGYKKTSLISGAEQNTILFERDLTDFHS